MKYNYFEIAIRMKEQIIVTTLDYIETKNKSIKDDLVRQIKAYAKHQRVNLRITVYKDINKTFRTFILNSKGTNISISNFYNSILKYK